MGYKIKAARYVEICHKVMNRPTKYRNYAPWNCGYYDGTYLYGDCWCFNPKVILWSESIGDPVCDNYTVGKYYYTEGIKASGMPDTTGDDIMAKYCTQVSFSKMLQDKKAPCLLLITNQHMGAYIGDFEKNGKTYNVCEFTPNSNLGDGLCPSYVDENGARRVCKGGRAIGYWDKAGYLTSFVDYSDTKTDTNTKTDTDTDIKNDTNTIKNGIDVSRYNGNVDYTKVKKVKIDFVIPRTGAAFSGCKYGDTYALDPYFIQNVKNAKSAGLVVNDVYHWLDGDCAEDGAKCAVTAIENVKKAGLPTTTVIWCDLEYTNAQIQARNLTNAKMRAMAEAFCDYCLEHGYPTGIYCNPNYIQNVFGKDILKKYDLWLAHWGVSTASYDCVYWQYGTTNISGIGDVDGNTYIGKYTVGTAKPQNNTLKNDTQDIVTDIDSMVLALEIYDGKWGINPDRQKNITAKYGKDKYREAQDYVNQIMNYKTYTTVAVEILNGKWGNNPDRQTNITAKYNETTYKVAQNYVNAGFSKTDISNGFTVALEILRNKWGNNPNRKTNITAQYGANVYTIAQDIVNNLYA